MLRAIMPKVESLVLYLDHIAERGRDLFRVACERDLEGIVGKYAHGVYHIDGRTTSWIKVKYSGYSQMESRHELFDQRMIRRPRGRGRSMTPELKLV
jgi:ATP-dependent DNA ligase